MVGAVAALWLLFSSSWVMLPFRLVVTLVHEANHALAVQLVGGDVHYVIVNEHGGGLTRWEAATQPSDTAVVFVASAGYVGTAVVGALLIEGAARLRRGRVAAFGLAALITAIGLAWVPLRVDPDPFSAAGTGSDSGDGWFTVLVCVLAVAALVGIGIQRSVRLRRLSITALATTMCLASVDDLRRVLDWSSRGGHSDAAIAAEVSPLSSWMWAGLWLLMGIAACAVGLWAALSGDRSRNDVSPDVLWSIPDV
jgi:hypothetical protein